MANLVKQSVDINFAQGLDTKTDPWRVPIGKFLSLINMVFTTGMRLTKRNGFGPLPALPSPATFLTTFNGNLTAIGQSLQAYSSSGQNWTNKGTLEPVELSTLSLIRSNTSQTQLDTAISNGLVCTVYTDQDPASLGSSRYLYVVADVNTGQNIVEPTLIPGSGTVTGSPRVFALGSYFIVAFTDDVAGTYHLKYLAISSSQPSVVTAPTDIISSYTPASTVSWDGVVVGNNLFFAWNSASGGQHIGLTKLSSTLLLTAPISYTTSGKVTATIMSMCADNSNSSSPIIWAIYYDSGTSTGYAVAINSVLGKIVSTPIEWISSGTILNVAGAAFNGSVNVYYEMQNAYGYDSGIPTNYINTVNMNTSATVSSASSVLRSVGLASKAFISQGYNVSLNMNSTYSQIASATYFLTAYQSPFQNTYFLVNGLGQVVSKLAYSNGGGYCTVGLPSVGSYNGNSYIGYLYKDFLEGANASQNVSITKTGIYSQTGLSLASFTIGTSNVVPSEIAEALHLSGGFLWEYDGYIPVEHNFFLWPDSVEVSTVGSGGNLTAQEYRYQAVYTWTDNQGNIHNSAPSVAVNVTTSASATNTIDIPTLRLTYKTANPVKIELFRWSTANQIFYQVTSITTPTLNDTTIDYVTFIDTQADSDIIGNSILYTTGGVIENIGAPSFNATTLFDDRLWGIDAEDPNLLWYSKQVIETTPVEMSDLLTLYVAPTLGSQGSTGPMKCIAPLDDKLIIFKENALYYINGTGPDNTEANSQYSEPFFITSVVGCANQQSIVFMPDGLMFQSDKGIWLLDRGMGVSYIGAPVEAFTQNALVQSALAIPETTQVRFTLDSGITLMYDYFYQQWGTFKGVSAISSTLYQNFHTLLDASGNIYQETPGQYLDGTTPVTMSFLTSWINLAGLQGYQRAYFMYLLGQYLSPHYLNVSLAYDYDPALVQSSLIKPDNYSGPYGNSSPYGQQTPYGGGTAREQWRIFFANQRCQAFQLNVQEIYDPSLGVPAGAGLTISGLNCLISTVRPFRAISSGHSVGGGTNGMNIP